MIRDRITPDAPRDPSSYSYAEDWQREPDPARTWRRPVMIALGAAAVLALCLSAAFADQFAYTDTPGGEQVGVLRYVNEEMWGGADTTETTLQTPHGPIVLLTTRTQNNLCSPACPDMLEVIAAPDGLIAVPGVVEVGESGAVDVRLMRWEGM